MNKSMKLGYKNTLTFSNILFNLKNADKILNDKVMEGYRSNVVSGETLIGAELPAIYKICFGGNVGAGRTKDQLLDSPFLRFAKAVLDQKGIKNERGSPFSAEGIYKYVKPVIGQERNGGASFGIRSPELVLRTHRGKSREKKL